MTDSAYAKGIGGDYLGDNKALPHIVDAKLHAAGYLLAVNKASGGSFNVFAPTLSGRGIYAVFKSISKEYPTMAYNGVAKILDEQRLFAFCACEVKMVFARHNSFSFLVFMRH